MNGIYGGRSLIRRNPNIDAKVGGFDGGLGLLRGYLASIGANKGFLSKVHLSDFNHILASSRLRRFFSSESPRKKSKKYIRHLLFRTLGNRENETLN